MYGRQKVPMCFLGHKHVRHAPPGDNKVSVSGVRRCVCMVASYELSLGGRRVTRALTNLSTF